MSWLSDTWDSITENPLESALGYLGFGLPGAIGFGGSEGGGGFSGLFGGTSADQSFAESMARNRAAWAPFRQEQAAALQQQQQQLMQALAAIQGGFGQAREQVGDIFAGQRTAAGDAATRTGAQVQQNLAQRGLGGTTYAGNLQRGVESDRQRALERIAGQEASVYAQLFPQQAAAEANIYGSLANIFGRDIDRTMQTYLTQFEHADAAPQSNPIWGLIGAGAGAYFGGPAGAGVGYQLGNQFGTEWA